MKNPSKIIYYTYDVCELVNMRLINGMPLYQYVSISNGNQYFITGKVYQNSLITKEIIAINLFHKILFKNKFLWRKFEKLLLGVSLNDFLRKNHP